MRLGRGDLLASALIVFAAVRGMAAQGPASAGPYTADLLRDLPSGANVFSILETGPPEVVSDRFNSGGLNAGQPARMGAFLASWSQTQYRIGDISISSPVDGTPLLFPEIGWWSQMQATTSLMPAGVTAPGLLVSLDPRRGSARWMGTFDAFGSGGGFTAAASVTRPPAIAELRDAVSANGVVSGPALDGRLSLFGGGAWRRASRIERGRTVQLRDETGSAFGHVVFSASAKDELRVLAWVQSVRVPSARDRSLHTQATFEHHGNTATRWRVFGGYSDRARTPERAGNSLVADRLVVGPIPSLIDGGNVTERRWSLGARVSRASASRHHALEFGGDVERTSSSASPAPPVIVEERIDGVAARVWRYASAGIASNRHALLVTAFAADRISLTSRLAIEAAIRFESADARARGAVTGIAWRTWLPSARLLWDVGTAFHLRFFTGVSRAANQPMLTLLASGDPAAPFADVFRWDGSVSASTTLVARVGPGTGGDPAFSNIDPQLRRPITDEFAIGFESRPKPSLRLSVTGLARRESSSINLVNIGVPLSSYATFTIPDANADWVGPSDDQQLPVYNQRPETLGQDRYLLTNPTQRDATMGAVVVAASVTTDRLFLQVGGTASAGVGSGGNRGFRAVENDQDVAGELFTNPNAQTYARGRLFSDRAYSIKWTTVYRFPSDIRLGAIARYQDGQPFSRMVVVPGLNQGTEAIQAFANGRSRFAFTGTLDARLQKGLAAGRVRLDLILDAYNLLNMTKEVEEYVVTGPRFRTTTAVQPPRVLHAGVRVTF